MLNFTNILLLILLLIFPYISHTFLINWFNSTFINLPVTIDLLSIFNYIASRTLIIVFFSLVVYSKIYLVESFNYPYFEYIYNIFFCSMLLLICSRNLITTLIA